MRTDRIGWGARIAVVAAVWAGICGLGLLLRMGPRPVVLAGACAAVAALWWLVQDVAGRVEPACWDSGNMVQPVNRGNDSRLTVLQRLVSASGDAHLHDNYLHPALVALVEDRLLAHHGIDATTEPERARAVLGDRLAAFVQEPAGGPGARDPRILSELVTRIESL